MGPDASKAFYENFLGELKKNYTADLIKGIYHLCVQMGDKNVEMIFFLVVLKELLVFVIFNIGLLSNYSNSVLKTEPNRTEYLKP